MGMPWCPGNSPVMLMLLRTSSQIQRLLHVNNAPQALPLSSRVHGAEGSQFVGASSPTSWENRLGRLRSRRMGPHK